MVLHAALEGEEGGFLQKEGSEGTGGGVGHGVALVGARAGIGQGGGGLAEAVEKRLEGLSKEGLRHIPSWKAAAAKSSAQKLAY